MAFRAATTADVGCAFGSPDFPDLADVENYAVTSSLNHNLHNHGLDSGSHPRSGPDTGEQPWPNYLEAHRWTHVMICWQMLPPW